MSKCPYCRAGDKPNEKGDHWIVKSIFPAKITIKKCRDVAVMDDLHHTEAKS